MHPLLRSRTFDGSLGIRDSRRLKTLSKKAKYGLRALYVLTREYGRGPVLIATLAEQEGIPKKFLEAILLELRNHGIVTSKKGRGGGYHLSKPPDQVTIGAVVRVIDGPLAPLACASESAFRKCDECADIETCETRVVMKQVRDAMAAILDRTTLAEICRAVDEIKDQRLAGEPLMYHI